MYPRITAIEIAAAGNFAVRFKSRKCECVVEVPADTETEAATLFYIFRYYESAVCVFPVANDGLESLTCDTCGAEFRGKRETMNQRIAGELHEFDLPAMCQSCNAAAEEAHYAMARANGWAR